MVITREVTPTHGATSASPSGAIGAPMTSRQEIAPPSQWPGLRGWPWHLSSTDWCMTRCPDSAALSLLLSEACVAVYIGMAAIALARLEARQLLSLLKNLPNEKVSIG